MSERPQSVIALQGLDLKLKMLAPTNLLPQGLKKQDLTQIQVICSKTETLWFPIRAKNEIRLVVVGRGGGGGGCRVLRCRPLCSSLPFRLSNPCYLISIELCFKIKLHSLVFLGFLCFYYFNI